MFCSRKMFASAVAFACIATPMLSQAKGFNPDISLILDGRYASISNSTDYALPGYFLGGEAGRGEEGFHLGHSELILSGNIDDLFLPNSLLLLLIMSLKLKLS